MQLKELIFLFYLNSYSELICRTRWHFLRYRFTFSPFNKHIIDKEYIITVTHKKRGTTSKLINWYFSCVFHLGYIPPSLRMNLKSGLKGITHWLSTWLRFGEIKI